MMLVALIVAFIGIGTVNAQEDCLQSKYLELQRKAGSGPFTEVIKNGEAKYYRRTGWYLGVNGAATARTINSEMSISPNAAIEAGYEFPHWHVEARGGALMFDFRGKSTVGLQSDLGVYYDFFPAKARKFNIYAGVFFGYQYMKVRYGIGKDCNDPESTKPLVELTHKENSVRAGLEVGVTHQLNYVHSLGIYARVYTDQYSLEKTDDNGNPYDEKFNPIFGEFGLRFTFGVGRIFRQIIYYSI